MRRPAPIASALALLAALALISAAPAAEARKRSRTPLVDPTTTPPGEVAQGIPKQWAPACDKDDRKPVSLVLGFDLHRDYGPARLYEAVQARGLLGQLCPGDRVQLVEVGRRAKRLGEAATMKTLADVDDLLLRVEERRARTNWKRSNAGLLQVAVEEWGQPVNTARDDLLRVLVFFTRDLESRAGKDIDVPDFSWASPPYWLQNHALVSVFRPIVSDTKVETWEVFVAATPEGTARGALSEGLRVTMDGWLDPARMLPRPAAPVVAEAAEEPVTEHAKVVMAAGPTVATQWPEPGGVLMWEPSWTPWTIAGVLLVLLLLGTLWVLFRAAPKRLAEGKRPGAPKLVLVLRDRLHDKVISEDKLDLKSSVRVGASLSNDLTVAGPYGLEILPSPAGALPRVRATNSLPIEVHRASGGRLVRATDSVPVPLRGGDRINLGAGQELEVRFAS